ncbi:MAG: hypothetical protein MZV63_25215 [Marinilabiliales bacterium]|nr:hypothetical protein [Marinilabiliales bacterium]
MPDFLRGLPADVTEDLGRPDQLRKLALSSGYILELMWLGSAHLLLLADRRAGMRRCSPIGIGDIRPSAPMSGNLKAGGIYWFSPAYLRCVLHDPVTFALFDGIHHRLAHPHHPAEPAAVKFVRIPAHSALPLSRAR